MTPIREINLHDRYIYFRVKRGMYGLVQVGIITWEAVKNHLLPFEYSPISIMLRLWNHTNKDNTFTLFVDDFGIKYVQKKDAQNHVTEDWTGKL